MIGGISGCGPCPRSSSRKVGAYALTTYTRIEIFLAFGCCFNVSRTCMYICIILNNISL